MPIYFNVFPTLEGMMQIKIMYFYQQIYGGFFCGFCCFVIMDSYNQQAQYAI